MHYADLTNATLKGYLHRGGVELNCKVMITAVTRNVLPNGSFGTGWNTYRFEITDRLLEMPRISMQRPRWPHDEDFTIAKTECQLRFENTDGQFAVVQDGAIFRAADIEQAKVDIYAMVGGIQVNWFSGRVNGRPNEAAGVTTITVAGFLWDCIRKPVVYEHFGYQTVSGGDGALTYTTVHVPCIGSHFCQLHGLLAFDSGGRVVTRMANSGGGVHLVSMTLSNGLRLGKYTIKFNSHTGYTLTCPDNRAFDGNIIRGIAPNSPIQIDRLDWSGSDGIDTAIEFWISWTATGNMVAMAYHLLEKALLENPGIFPGNPAARLDVAAFTELAARFESFTGFVDATNEDNDVWEGSETKRPLEYATLAQRILGHLQCSITMMIDGTISVTGPYLDNVPAWPLASDRHILAGASLIGGDTVNYIQVQFGGDPSGGFGAPIIRDLRQSPTALKVEKTFSLPYFKLGSGTRCALWWERTMTRRMMADQTLIDFTVEPGAGLLLAAGDRVTVEYGVLPVFERVVEIIEVDRGIGTECRVKAAIVFGGEGAPARVNAVTVDSVGLW